MCTGPCSQEQKGILREHFCRDGAYADQVVFSLLRKERFVKHVRQEGIVPENLDQYFGYGLCVGSDEPGPRPKIGQVVNPILPGWPMRLGHSSCYTA